MAEPMDRWGIGFHFAFVSIIIATVVTVLTLGPFTILPAILIPAPASVIVPAGVALATVGLIIFSMGERAIGRQCSEGRLATEGVYSWIRHPIYASWIVLIAPGIALIVGYVMGLVVPVLMYLAFRLMIKEEESCLERRFGQRYLDYRRRVGGVFPKFYIKGKDK